MTKNEHLHGTLDLLVLKVLRSGPMHGLAIATAIRRASNDVLRVEAGSLYPALHRMAHAGLLDTEWKISDAGRQARFYKLTAKGRKRLGVAEERWRSVSAAVAKVLRTV